ncbi:MAG: aminotransferase class I/II-fold pyridoxal phosphate-dependent enzyme [Planctomycetota bacterium]|nr:aminotransferase class I/II-fold pyridoxal phosphate-dependent enzyme [Planctomycetota bacterium]MDA1179487.1 aminotransferase class I/II-fold pyridoxal phosphate-dependent enzyme [Planctomycetota bacterium]
MEAPLFHHSQPSVESRSRSVNTYPKTELRDLARWGGPPAFVNPLHVGRPNVVGREALLRRFQGVLESGWLSNDGPELRRFEEEVARRLDVRHCVATCNATIALQLVARALELSGEVIIPSLTFPATAHALAWQGITPVFADVSSDSWTIDVEHVESLISHRTTAIMGVHLFGTPCRIERLQEIANRYRLRLLFDACHAFGCTHNERYLGSFGDAEVFSFHATKFINAGEGGAVTTNNFDLAQRLRRLRNFGFDLDGEVHEVGLNGKMSAFAAAAGSVSLAHMEEIVSHNYSNLVDYQRVIGPIPGICMRRPSLAETNNFQYIVAEIDPLRFGLTRDEVFLLLRCENCLARRYFFPGCHRLPAYLGASPPVSLPSTDAILDRVLILPTGLSIDSHAISVIGDLLRFMTANASFIREALSLTPGDAPGIPREFVRIEGPALPVPVSHYLDTMPVHLS